VKIVTWREMLRSAGADLSSSQEARWVVERASGWDGAELWSHLDEAPPARAAEILSRMVERRVSGEPLQYVLGRWPFRGLDLVVDRRVLIPRPETETVAEVAAAELRRIGPRAPKVVDLGTGSGALALSIAAEFARARVWATDASADALAVARANLAGLGSLVAVRVRLAEGSWWAALPPDLRGQVDLVVSNPPYVATDEALPPEIAEWEPVSALRAGPTGLEALTEIVAEAPVWLARPGVLVTEIAPHQAEPAVALAMEAGFAHVEVRPDFAGRPRSLVASI